MSFLAKGPRQYNYFSTSKFQVNPIIGLRVTLLLALEKDIYRKMRLKCNAQIEHNSGQNRTEIVSLFHIPIFFLHITGIANYNSHQIDEKSPYLSCPVKGVV